MQIALLDSRSEAGMTVERGLLVIVVVIMVIVIVA